MAKSGHPCARCRGTMDEGYVLDRGNSDRGHEPTWVAGAPEPSFWTGLKTKDRKVLGVTTWRCRDCGLLESYAN